ncbi:MAG: hypothetical protein ABI921_12810 [Panacibacter sp.]
MQTSMLILFTNWLVAVEALAAIAGFLTWKKWKDHYLKWFPVYLTMITVRETCYHIFSYLNKGSTASLMYEIAVPVEILFISWFFYCTLTVKNRKVVLAGALLYIVSLVLEKILIDAQGYYFRSLSYTTGNLFILIYLILFLIELVRSEKIFNFQKITVFWIAVGLLIFYMGTFPFYGLYNELAKDINLFIPVAWAATFLNYSMYLCFTIGFIWGKPH